MGNFSSQKGGSKPAASPNLERNCNYRFWALWGKWNAFPSGFRALKPKSNSIFSLYDIVLQLRKTNFAKYLFFSWDLTGKFLFMAKKGLSRNKAPPPFEVFKRGRFEAKVGSILKDYFKFERKILRYEERYLIKNYWKSSILS